ncbi:uncharacterized protein [Euwallacea similis]|uniref:uncharacterized protein n=1 Tax=Euwallacea similis TaxID=1736056 RepID=UPI00344F0051
MLLTPVTERSPNMMMSSDQLYNPVTNFSQSELMEKFNLAFYEAQTISKRDIADTFENYQEKSEENDDYLIDYLISEDAASPQDCDINFDFNDFVEDFDQNVRDSFSDSTTTDFDTGTFTTETSAATFNENPQFSNFFVPPPIWINLEDSVADKDKNSLNGIDLCEVLSSGSLDWNSDVQSLDQGYSNSLPPVGTITKNNFDFNCYVRTVPEDDMGYFKTDLESKSEYGHLVGSSEMPQQIQVLEENQMVLKQSEALLNDDPLLSSSNNFYNNHIQISMKTTESETSEEIISTRAVHYQCRWQNCYQKCHSQTGLVGHIEKCHVEVKRGDEFTCYWEHCPRKTKPFNARYKLLIHMRVHSGEKPNKCPFKGCIKAFSRLENLKIHQRSHTGERPYLCQFNGCLKCFSNSSDRAKHQRTHFDTKPYACQVIGCHKKYTDPSSLRKHVKNHTHEEQLQIKKKSQEDCVSNELVKKFLDPSRQKAIKIEPVFNNFSADHTYSTINQRPFNMAKYVSINVKQDLKNKIEKNKIRRIC